MTYEPFCALYAFLCNCEISGLRREVAEYCAVLGYYAASNGIFLPTFRDNISLPSSGFKFLNQDVGNR